MALGYIKTGILAKAAESLRFGVKYFLTACANTSPLLKVESNRETS